MVPNREPLFTKGFRLLLLTALLGWIAEGMVQTVLPLRILDLGGSAATVGLVAACFAIPTLLLRPAIGRRIDRSGHGRLHQLGVLIGVLAPLGYLAGSLVLMPFNRLAQGAGWAIFGTSNNVATARLAPASRRGEASGYFNFAYALGFLVGPPLGLFLYEQVDPGSPFLAGSLVAVATLVAVTFLRRVTPGAAITASRAADAKPLRAGAGPGGVFRRLVGAYLEPAGIPMLVVAALFMAGQGLFLGFAVVYARTTGLPVAWLTPFFPMYGVLNALVQLGSGRLTDRIGRVRAVALGTALGSIGLLVAALPFGFATYAVGAACFAVASGIVGPAAGAAAMDSAPDGRLGVTMGTFSMAYQLASGVGGLVWGLIIASVGYPWPFLVAVVLQVASVSVALRWFAVGPAVARRTPHDAPPGEGGQTVE